MIVRYKRQRRNMAMAWIASLPDGTEIGKIVRTYRTGRRTSCLLPTIAQYAPIPGGGVFSTLGMAKRELERSIEISEAVRS